MTGRFPDAGLSLWVHEALSRHHVRRHLRSNVRTGQRRECNDCRGQSWWVGWARRTGWEDGWVGVRPGKSVDTFGMCRMKKPQRFRS